MARPAHELDSLEVLHAELLRFSQLESLQIVAGGIAHDFNNLLTAILGGISLLKLEFPTDKHLGKRLTDIENASKRARDLTKQLLTFSKGDPLVRIEADISEVIRDTVAFALHGSTCRFQLAIPDDLYSATVDSGQISQVISNLVINAAQAMRNGGTILVECENCDLRFDASGNPLVSTEIEPGRYIRIGVHDHGDGIPPELLAHIYEPFFTTKAEGTGLGLTTSRSIVRAHGGELIVDSTVGEGTTFWVYLPASTVNSSRSDESVPTVLHHGAGRILLVDDEELVRETAENMLAYLGYEVATASNAGEAFDLLINSIARDRRFDAMIVDLTLPGEESGEQIFRHCRQLDPQLLGVVTSGYMNSPVMTDYGRYGFSSRVFKPFEISELSDVLAMLLEAKSSINM